jgi:hypothetical protein
MFGARDANQQEKTETIRLAVRDGTNWARVAKGLFSARKFAPAIRRTSNAIRT